MNNVAHGNGSYLLVPEAKIDFSRFIRNNRLSHISIVSISGDDAIWLSYFQNFCLQANMVHSGPQVFDGVRMGWIAFFG